jgi:DNA topoisomerase-1
VLFPPNYAPHGVKLLYNGQPVELSAEQEECATWYAAMKDTDYGQDPKFQENFFEDWRRMLATTAEGKVVKEFKKCDFSRIAEHVKAEIDAKKERSREDKEAERQAKNALEERFLFATIDGRKEKVGNFRVEPPELFRGRGDHPKRGRVKKRVFPEDITINLGKGAPVPPVPDMGDSRKHRWGEVVHENKVTWLAKWKDTLTLQDKCVWLSANSAWKGMSDMAKYSKARMLKQHIERVRTDYTKGMADKALKMQQRSVAVYLIDQLALRVGGEKNTEEEADTVGCCSLRAQHVTLHDGNRLELNFLGKDSIQFHNTVEVLPQVHALIGQFLKRKKPGDDLFDQIKPSDLNDYFHEVMKDLTAKVGPGHAQGTHRCTAHAHAKHTQAQSAFAVCRYVCMRGLSVRLHHCTAHANAHARVCVQYAAYALCDTHAQASNPSMPTSLPFRSSARTTRQSRSTGFSRRRASASRRSRSQRRGARRR